MCVPALAADLTGKWNAAIESEFGTIDMQFDLTADGDKLTGTIAAGEMMPAMEISEGKIDGDEFAFVVAIDMGGEPAMTINYTGRIDGDELAMVSRFSGMPGAGEQVTEFAAVRAE